MDAPEGFGDLAPDRCSYRSCGAAKLPSIRPELQALAGIQLSILIESFYQRVFITPEMFCLSLLIYLASLPGSFEVQNGYNGFGQYYRATADHRYEQNMALPHPQGLSHLQVSPSHHAESRIGQAEDYPHQPITPPYQLQQFTSHPHWPGADPLLSTHPSNDSPQGQGFRTQNHPSYPVPQQPSNFFDGIPHQALNLPSAHESTLVASDGLAPYQREWDIVDFLLMHEGTNMPSRPITHSNLPSEGNSNMASASDLPAFGSLGSQTLTDHFRELQNGLDTPNDFSWNGRPSTGFSSGTTDSHSNRPRSFGQSNDNEGDSMTGFQRMRELNSRPIPQTDNEDDLIWNRRKRQKGSHPDHPVVDKAGEPDSHIQDTLDVSKTFPVSNASDDRLKLAQFAAMLITFEEWNRVNQGRSIDRLSIVKQTVRHWLPVYKAYLHRLQGCSEIKDKLATLFEQLWITNQYLLYSYDYDILNNHGLLLERQEDMLSWVANELFELPSSFASRGSPARNPTSKFSREVKQPILTFLRAPRETDHITITMKNRFARIKRETTLACELAFFILDVHYNTNDQKQWRFTLGQFPDIRSRMKSFISAVNCSSTREWITLKKSRYRKLDMVPWSKNRKIPALAPSQSSQKEFNKICQVRLQEIHVIFEEWSIDREFNKLRQEYPIYTDIKKQSLQDYAMILSTIKRIDQENEEILTEYLNAFWNQLFNSAFQPTQQNRILAHIFRSLWTIHRWLLNSCNPEILEQENYYKGQKDMLEWVANQLLKNKEKLPDLGAPHLGQATQNLDCVGIKTLITNFMKSTEEVKNDYIYIQLRKREYLVTSEDAQGCELAINILNSYYKSTNKVQWLEKFYGNNNIFYRMKGFINGQVNGTTKRWMKKQKWLMTKDIVPWKDNNQ